MLIFSLYFSFYITSLTSYNIGTFFIKSISWLYIFSAIRQAYLQNGGNDPDVLAQMSQMQAEAQTIEDQANQKQEYKSPRGNATFF